jgi:hypothetical protein
MLAGDQARSLSASEHELVFVCSGESVTATLDGKPCTLEIEGNPKRGYLQFGAVGGAVRILSIDLRN